MRGVRTTPGGEPTGGNRAAVGIGDKGKGNEREEKNLIGGRGAGA